MAKINLTTQHNQENLTALASLGVLICMIVTLVGIKLWWFKHRLSFEQKNSPTSSTNGGPTPSVLVPRRNKQPKYKRDKRYSQEIYESVEVHGVFRQKREDDFEIEKPIQLPPVRIRQTSEGDSFIIRPPPRTKRRDKIHSTAFEDLEIAPSPDLAAASSSDLSLIPEINTKITLTFEEFEKEFNLKEINSASINNETNEIPKPPLRLNRSSSTTRKLEKPERFLKSSQSITIPEFHKVIQKRSIGLSSPKEDLTKIDFYEEVKIFDNFPQSKESAAGYIRYEEVDNDLHERQLNANTNKLDYNFVDSEFYESSTTAMPVKSLGNEGLIYNQDLNDSLSVHSLTEFNFNIKPYRTNEWEEIDFKQQNRDKEFELNDSIYYENNEERSKSTRNPSEIEKDSTNFEKNYISESNKDETISESNDNDFGLRECFSDEEENETMIRNLKETNIFQEELKPELKAQNMIENETIAEINVKQINDERDHKSQSVNNKKSQEFSPKSFAKTIDNESFEENYEKWPQYEEKIETPEVTVRRFNSCNLDTQNSFNENDDLETSSIYSYKNETGNNVKAGLTLKERRPTGYVTNRSAAPEFEDIEEWQEAFNNKFYNQVRSFITAESITNFDKRQVSFDSSVLQQNEKEISETSEIKQRRPTGYIKENEYFVTLYDESDEETYDEHLHCHPDTRTLQLSKVKFEDACFRSEQDTEKFTLNQRRPTEFVRNESRGMFETQIKFDATTVFKDAEQIEHSIVKQRRPTGYIKKLQVLDLSDNESIGEEATQGYDKNNALKNEEIFQNGAKVRFLETEKDFKTTTESLVKQRTPTGYIQQVVAPDYSIARFYDTEKDVKDTENISLVSQEVFPDYPTVRFLESEKNFTNDQINTESLVKQRRPTGYVPTKISTDSPTARFLETEKNYEDYDTTSESLVKLRKPTGCGFALEKHVSSQMDNDNEEISSQQNPALQQDTLNGFTKNEEKTRKHVNFQLKQIHPKVEKSEYDSEQLKQRRPTGFGNNTRKELKCLDKPAPIYQPTDDDYSNQDFIDDMWQELERDVAQDVNHNFEEEFAKIRHSYEVNEADFLELKDELQNSPTDLIQQPLGFGKSIDDDWENFEKLKNQITVKPSPNREQKIKITFSDNDLTNTTSILKDSKLEEDVQPKLRKSKVTFDFKTEEHFIPARNRINSSEEDTDFDDKYQKHPPQPLKRVTNINYNNETVLTPSVTIPTSITLFGTQISAEDKNAGDSLTIIHKHSNTTHELQNVATNCSQTLQATSLNMPPKAIYRNPMAQLAIQRAKEARADMDGFKSRSINDRKPEASNKQKQKLINLSNVDHEQGTEA